MSPIATIPVTVVAVCLSTHAHCASDIAELAKLKDQYTAKIESVRASRQSFIENLNANYLKSLERLGDELRSEGNLEALLVLKREKDRLAKAGAVSPRTSRLLRPRLGFQAPTSS